MLFKGNNNKIGVAILVFAGICVVLLYITRHVWAPPVKHGLLAAFSYKSTVTSPVSKNIVEKKICSEPSMELDLYSSERIPDKNDEQAVKAEIIRKYKDDLKRYLGRDPQFILAYPQTVSTGSSDDVKFSYASGVLGEGTGLARYVVVDAVTNDIVLDKSLPSENYPLYYEKCRSWYKGGCQFTEEFTIAAKMLNTGLYYLFLTDDKGADSYPVFFNIRPESTDLNEYDIIAIIPEYTWHAYNRFGGGSLYSIFDRQPTGELQSFVFDSRLYSASLQRPMLHDPTGKRFGWDKEAAIELFKQSANIRFDVKLDIKNVYMSKIDQVPGHSQRNNSTKIDHPYWMQRYDESPSTLIPFVRLLRSRNYKVAAITQYDLQEDHEILNGAKLVMLTGHHEYWTKHEREVLSAAAKKGTAIANFAGNVNYGQVELLGSDLYFDQLGASNRKLSCIKKIPVIFSDTGFIGYHIFPGSEYLLGLSYRFGGYPLKEYRFSKEDLEKFNLNDEHIKNSSKLEIVNDKHPIFNNTGLSTNKLWDAGPLVSIEIDGLPINDQGKIDKRFSEDIPDNIKILANAWMFSANAVNSLDLTSRYYGINKAAIAVEAYPFGRNAGRVISFGTIGYATSLALGDDVAEKIFLNSIEYLLH